MHAFLITSGTPESRQKHIRDLLDLWKVSSFDTITADTDNPSIGIEQVRELERRSRLMPFNSPWSVLIINEAHLLTIEAQNALLKTLEEPPPHLKIILESQTADVFLPTVISRCQHVLLEQTQRYSSEELHSALTTIKKIFGGSIGTRFNTIDTIAKTREEAEAWIQTAIAAVHMAFEGQHDSTVVFLLRRLLDAQKHLAANVNYKLVLDHIFLHDGVDRA